MQPISPRRAAHAVLAALAWAGGLGLLGRWLTDVLSGPASATSVWASAALALGGAFWLGAGALHAQAGRCLAEREPFPLACTALALCGHLIVLAGAAVLFLRGEASQGFVGVLSWLPPVVLTLGPLSLAALGCEALAARRSSRLVEGSIQRQAALQRLSWLAALLGTACCGALLLNERTPRASQRALPAAAARAAAQGAAADGGAGDEPAAQGADTSPAATP